MARDVDCLGVVADFGADYWDAFRITGLGGVRPSSWAAASLGAVEVAHRAFGIVVWGGLLGFDLAPRDTDGALVGWQVTADTQDQFFLDADGSRMAGRMAFTRDGDDLVWTTMLRHHSASGPRVWAVLSPVHRAIAPRSLMMARRALAREA
ncbi:MAG TPA: hypothetical protein VGM94_14080 [Galbitalea sp.]